ncbi:MAG: hypothetical protein A2527_09565 [Candidatus Lambdaproteobacteria bacterium RIFOXYD2_FULL_50_16]|uniref:Uncharacterized protein n=1 Tax=Candidatus Lambdaproteobacteria bacterium RIFOXYD2_FULL_50_16 TaxID=1817772 RepID=A0A1F6G7L0_9PROT|nr:MAG: hypothetical protein A2527_09565 [Candidatus Lambdaproteobacteria bacterium RIFOXYD2_FULL_50_16]
MYNLKWILPPFLAFLAILTYPLWSGPKGAMPELAKPKGEACVESATWMRANHMQLLDHWREEVVRNQSRVYVNQAGQRFEKSLTKTCLSCHNNKQEFCDRCHNYTSVKPYCFECHVDPKLSEVSHVQ